MILSRWNERVRALSRRRGTAYRYHRLGVGDERRPRPRGRDVTLAGAAGVTAIPCSSTSLGTRRRFPENVFLRLLARFQERQVSVLHCGPGSHPASEPQGESTQTPSRAGGIDPAGQAGNGEPIDRPASIPGYKCSADSSNGTNRVRLDREPMGSDSIDLSIGHLSSLTHCCPTNSATSCRKRRSRYSASRLWRQHLDSG